MSRPARRNPARAVVRGLLAGAAGTAAMDALLFARYRRTGGESELVEWEFSSGLSGWDDAPAPAQVGKRLFEGLSGRELAPERARLVNNVTHWAYGMAGGAQYAVVAAWLRAPRIRYGLPFGASVWGAGYVVLPIMKLYRPIWEYDRRTLADDLGAHLVYGLGTASALRLLTRAESSCS